MASSEIDGHGQCCVLTEKDWEERRDWDKERVGKQREEEILTL